MQTYNSIMCVYFCTRFIDFMLKSRGLLDYTNLFSPNKHQNNDNLILNYLQKLKKLIKKIYCIICDKYRKFKKSKNSYIFEKILVLSIICSKFKNENEKIFKEKESI